MNNVYLALPSHFPKAHKDYLQKIISFLKDDPKIKLTADFHWLNGDKGNVESASAIIEKKFNGHFGK